MVDFEVTVIGGGVVGLSIARELSLSGKSPFKKLIYPLPEKNGLGIHSTINLDGVTIFGPDTVEVEDIDFNVTKNIKKNF